MTKDDKLVEAVREDYRKAELAPRHRTMLDYVAKLTATPRSVVEEDVEKLRRAGFDDASISDINLICAYFNMLNRIAMGLGIELDKGTRAPL